MQVVSDQQILLVVQLVFTVVGLGMLVGVLSVSRTVVGALRAPQRMVGDITSGPVILEGRVGRHEETLTSPLGEECVAYDTTVKPATGPAVGGEGGTPENIAKEAVPFTLRDDTGEVLVDSTPRNRSLDPVPASLAYYLRDDNANAPGLQLSDDARQETLAATDGMLEKLDIAGYPMETGDEVDVREYVLQEGDEVHVLGTVVELSDAHGGRTAVLNRRFHPFRIDTQSPETQLVLNLVAIFLGSLVVAFALGFGLPGVFELLGLDPPYTLFR